MHNLAVFSGSQSQDLTKRICDYIEIEQGKSVVTTFPDSETMVKIDSDARGKDCFIIQSTHNPTNNSLMELLITIDCLKRASAKRITAVIPYYGYARQDRKTGGRTPITAKLVADLISAAGADRVLTMDLHAMQIEGFFNIPVDHMKAEPVFVKYFKSLNLKNFVILSPDVGNTKTANLYAQDLGGDIAVIDKRRISGDETIAKRIIGSVDGKDILIVDDLISTASTMCSAAELAIKSGAKSVRIAATHGLFSPPAMERIEKSSIDEIIISDTVPLTINQESHKIKPIIKVLSIAPLLGEAILRIYQNRSLSVLLNCNNKMYTL
jgi:ribose-phosphate pyrophosphokinase